MKKSKRLAIMLKHRELVKVGKYEVAYKLLRLLVKKQVTLGFSDACCEAEKILERLKCYETYDTHNFAIFYDFSINKRG
jgi:hypothetical protein